MPDGSDYLEIKLAPAVALTIACGPFNLQVPIDATAFLLLNFIDTVTPCNPVALGIASAWRASLFPKTKAPDPLVALQRLGVTVRELSDVDDSPAGMEEGDRSYWINESNHLVRSVDVHPTFELLATAIGAKILMLSGIDFENIQSGKHDAEAKTIGAWFVVPRELIDEVIGEIPERVSHAEADGWIAQITDRTHASADTVCHLVHEHLAAHFGHHHWEHAVMHTVGNE